MKLSGVQQAWEILGWVVAGYSIYQKLNTLDQIKNDLFPYLSPENQAILNQVIGAPAPAATASTTLVSGVIPAAAAALPSQASSTLTQVKAGT